MTMTARFILMTLSLVLASCMTAEPGSDAAGTSTSSETATAEETDEMTTPAYRLLEKGGYGMAAQAADVRVTNPSVEVATSAAEYSALWRTHIGDSQLPHVDFSKESVVFLLMGARSTGGYGVAPKAVKLDGATAVVTAEMIRPGKGDMTTQAFTAPFAVIAIESTNVQSVEWHDAAGQVAVEHRQ